MSELNPNSNHNVILNDRKHISVHGVKCVNSFSEELVSVTTMCDEFLYIEGRQISVEEVNLEKGIVEATGIITGLFYEDKIISNSKSNSLVRSLFGKR